MPFFTLFFFFFVNFCRFSHFLTHFFAIFLSKNAVFRAKTEKKNSQNCDKNWASVDFFAEKTSRKRRNLDRNFALFGANFRRKVGVFGGFFAIFWRFLWIFMYFLRIFMCFLWIFMCFYVFLCAFFVFLCVFYVILSIFMCFICFFHRFSHFSFIFR
jgi:hypothetical protein